MLVIIDYGAGNLRSVARAVEKLGQPATISHEADNIRRASKLILPGVGAARDTMQSLRRLRLIEPIAEAIAADKPFFGICLGLQVLLDGSEEGGWEPCLGVYAGRVRRLPDGLKVPHMGWNQVRQRREHPVFEGIPDGTNFYFVHSYYPDPADPSLAIGSTEYGVSFTCAIARGNLVATQFHPEKSGRWGLRMLENFFRNYP
ncbi:MAG: imidazole glycerol phosphate synthase subunit HisH [Chloroflexi bacterium]|nr:imidazole glycerol phosphate synthase subunit HisH [Chloroflexota bacterium]